MSKDFATDYIDVAARIVTFREQYPEGSLQPADLATPYRIETIGDSIYISVVAAAYRTPDDVRPGVGMAYELFPGKTPYTRGSELQNAETSAWGRAIVATLAADTKRGVASANEVRNAQANQSEIPESLDGAKRAVAAEWRRLGMNVDDGKVDYAATHEGLVLADADLPALLGYLDDLRRMATP